MAKYYVTIGDAMTQAVNTFVAAQTLPDGSTLSSIKVPPDMKKISELGIALSHDVAAIIDTGCNFTLQLSGTGLVDGIQEFNLGALASQETGTSVTGDLTIEPALYRKIDINVKPGEIVAAIAMDGTDCGSPLAVITLGFE